MILKQRDTLALAAILLAAILVRGYFFLRIPPADMFAPWYREAGDAVSYNDIALNLLRGAGYAHGGIPTADRPPAYPFFLAGVYGVFGAENFAAVRAAQIILGALSLFLLYRIGAGLGRPLAGLLAALAYALHPLLVTYNLSILTETLMFFLTAIFLYLVLRWDATEKPSYFLAASAALGVMSLTRPTALTVIFPLLLWARYRTERSARMPAKMLLGGVAVFALVLLPWTARNWRAFGAFVPVSNIGGRVFADSLDKTVLDSLNIPGGPDVQALIGAKSETAAANAGYRYFIAEALRDPSFVVGVTAKKFLYWWSPAVKTENRSIRYGLAAANTLQLAFGIGGIILLLRGRGRNFAVFLLLFFLNFTVIHALTAPHHRYRFPVIDPYLAVMAGYAIAAFWERRSAQGLPSPAGKATSPA